MVEQKQKVLAASAGVTDPSFLFVNSQLLESEMIDFGLNMGCEMYSVSLRRSSLSCYLRELRVVTSLLLIGLITKEFFDELLLLSRTSCQKLQVEKK